MSATDGPVPLTNNNSMEFDTTILPNPTLLLDLTLLLEQVNTTYEELETAV